MRDFSIKVVNPENVLLWDYEDCFWVVWNLMLPLELRTKYYVAEHLIELESLGMKQLVKLFNESDVD